MEQRCMRLRDAAIREEDGKKYLAGYFAVFDEEYEVYPGWVETIAPGAFARCLADGGDVKVLWNHDTGVVLGSTAAGTATLREDETGLFGTVEINEDDQEAVNVYARIQRGDVDGCSFGFDIASQEERWEDGIYYTRITDVAPLYEVSPCTFPAYKATSISAREKLANAQSRYEHAKNKKINDWRESMRRRLKGES